MRVSLGGKTPSQNAEVKDGSIEQEDSLPVVKDDQITVNTRT